MSNPCLFALLCLLSAAAFQRAAGTDQPNSTPASTIADKWATAAAEIVGRAASFPGTKSQVAARLARLGADLSGATDSEITTSSKENGIEKFSADFWSEGLHTMKIVVERTDPQGHRVFPRLRSLLAQRFGSPGWRLRHGWNQLGKMAAWERPNDFYSLVLTDTGTSVTVEVIYEEGKGAEDR